jgi:hypothetical protein
VIKRLSDRPAAVFVLVYSWKIVLFLISAQPVSSNDSFFYDGPAVNLLLHGRYANPSLALALPISGNELFCAYPPLYQFALLGWMAMVGSSVISAMAFHLVLFGIYLLLLLAIFRRLKFPLAAIHIAGLFLLIITFHDRPDSLAHVFGISAVYALVRSRRSLSGDATGASKTSWPWTWVMALLAVLGIATGLQIGLIYLMLLWLGMLATTVVFKERFPFAPMIASLLIPAGLVALVLLRFPHIVTGFLEHARQTPALTGWRRPEFTELLKMLRNLSAVLLASILLPWLFKNRRVAAPAGLEGVWLFTSICTAVALAVIGASMVLLTANYVFFAAYLQPLVVAGCLTLAASIATPQVLKKLRWAFVLLAALGSIRAVGMSTWGLACARDVSYFSALRQVRHELEARDTNRQAIVFSSAYLYEAARHRDFQWIHCDWLAPVQRGQPNSDRTALLALKPAKLILTQFDFYRRYEGLVKELQSRPDLVEVRITNAARLPPPDSIRSMQKVVQHISWAPVMVTFSWK